MINAKTVNIVKQNEFATLSIENALLVMAEETDNLSSCSLWSYNVLNNVYS